MLTDSCSNIGLGVAPVLQWCLGCSLGKDMYNHPHFKTIIELLLYLSGGCWFGVLFWACHCMYEGLILSL